MSQQKRSPSKKKVPSYLIHKPSGQARVRINGKDHYLGPFGSVESYRAYGDLISQHAAGVPQVAPQSAAGFTVNEIVLAFLRHAQKHYVKDGRTTSEYDCFCSAVRPLVALYGETQASGPDGFTASKLRAVRDKMIDLGWSRKYINKSCGRIRQVFRFAYSHDLLGSTLAGAAVVTNLDAMEPLLKGRCQAVELPPRTAVPRDHIDAIRAKVNQRTRDMIDLCLLTGARPGELVSLTTGMIDTSGDVWTATLADHKMIHHGKTRVLAFGPKAKLILRRYLRSDGKTRLFPIRRDTFTKTIVYWCNKLGLPKFTAHWLRHNAATEIRAKEDLDSAQVLMGHSDSKTTQIYAHFTDERVIELARKHG
ncbi:tyrosine-type recombinase/integrase [Schlesneria sp. DSM 10557]|uniref:tyrosine-type recombinase/integrase n=1 Tax=Schlesneria sp. DSM 10557 TaxID=3044399 RepID=UPI0035A031BE